MTNRTVIVVPHNPVWAEMYQAEAGQVSRALASQLIAIHHVGSTAIVGIKAKPIIDLMAEVRSIEAVDAFNLHLEALGYQPKGEFGIPRRRYFSKDTGAVRTHHLHVFEHDNPEVARHLLFRDFLLAHPEDALAYSRLKERLAQQFPTDPHGYNAAKTDFIRAIDRRAAVWSPGSFKHSPRP